jgi:ATP-dependent RNA helicase SUPV3L1/SUV3
MNASFKEQLNKLLNCDLKSLYPTARQMKRKLYFYVGATNSGKTYSAMQELMSADTGTYLAPLRLLALENYEYLNKNNIPSSLITGEEQKLREDAFHICSTIEMLNFSLQSDVCVIDEVQMLEDKDRGWAWVNAILGAPSSKVIMTGSVNAIDSIKKIASYLGEDLEIKRFQRKNPLEVLPHHIALKDVTKGTALIAFSRNNVLKLKSKLSKYFKVSVLYGNLSPEVRTQEATRFREGQTDILIATDAIAMGLNLPIKTILFTTDTKFDGVSKRKLLPNEVVQISGRAGRYGHHEIGYIGAIAKNELSNIKDIFNTPVKTIKPPFNVKATIEQIKELATYLQTQSLSKILKFYSSNMKFSGPFKAANIGDMISLANILDKKAKLSLEQKFILSQAPINTRSPLIKDAYFRYINAVLNNKPYEYKSFIKTSKKARTQDDLLKAEDEVKKISLYLWLSYKLPDIFVDEKFANNMKVKVNKYCENSLKVKLIEYQRKRTVRNTYNKKEK